MTPLRALIRRLDGARNLADACQKKLYRRYSCALLAREAVMMRLATTLARPAALAQPAARAPRAGRPTSRNVGRPRAAAPAAFASRGAVAPWAGRRTAGARRVAAAVRVRAFASLGLRGSSQASRSHAADALTPPTRLARPAATRRATRRLRRRRRRPIRACLAAPRRCGGRATRLAAAHAAPRLRPTPARRRRPGPPARHGGPQRRTSPRCRCTHTDVPSSRLACVAAPLRTMSPRRRRRWSV